MTMYYRPIAQTDPARPEGALVLAGGWCWFDRVEVLTRGGSQGILPAAEVPADLLARLCAPRPALAGLALDRPQVMGILNVTPDSFSDGGRFVTPGAALARARKMADEGMAILDIGGESTRPGAPEVSSAEEVARTGPVIAGLRDGGFALPISIDTRKASVAAVALQVGADLVNDVSGLSFDPGLAGVVANAGAPLCLMHSQGTPATMHLDPRYDDVLLDVYDALAERVAVAEAGGIPRARICIDPGIGFGKTLQHNLTLLRGLSLFHGLGCAILLGVSRKRFIGSIGQAPEPAARMPGTLALTLAGLAQGAQIHRVHDVAEVTQGIRLWQAVQRGYNE